MVTADAFDRLSRREREILALIAAGRSNAGISDDLFVAQKTVESHIASILTKLDIPRSRSHNPRVLAVRAWCREVDCPRGDYAP
ncbi:DNA-binding NarL/FixJ family response regulator [Kineosphaera limosa]|uniref:Putative two-component response regulator n=1 Tax=Kineosphaera limosa NBRC 100340 TaxID=1184609 RepID=K6VMZ5_9MICO|nr:helix-turn-helix transcriptional regulator [Kineosphaera limosa]NYE01167.1 DNA-binding NarL/FixJ family response regulator [Kineosphaera limosa]GAB97598.1 putative two-component response regulator [Kineosphaera limosa NBRC 100340]